MTRDGWFKIGLLLLAVLVLFWLDDDQDERSSWLSARRDPARLVASLRPGPDEAPSGSALSFRSDGDYDRLVRTGAFGLKPRSDPPKANVPPAPTPRPTPPPTAPPLRDLDVDLVGTLVGDSTRYAFLFDRKSKRQDFLAEGDSIRGAKVVAIRRNEVDLERDGARTTLRVDFAGDDDGPPVASRAAAPRPRSAAPRPAARPAPRPRGTGQTSSIQMSRAEINRNLSNLQRLSREVRVQPYFRQGKLTGFMLSNVRRDSFIERMGARNGDVVQAVDGKPIDSVQKAFALYNTFRNRNEVSLTVLRGGRPHTIKYEVR